MTAEPPFEWSRDEMIRHGEATLRQIGDYFEDIRERPITVDITTDAMMKILDDPPPETAEDFDAILTDTMVRVVPYLGHWNHPRFHGYFSISGSYPAALAELFCAAVNVNTMMWQTAPAAAALETIVLRWIAGFVGYPQDSEGVIVPGASLATFYAFIAARELASPTDVSGYAETGAALRIYASDQAHSSVEKAARALGVGSENLVRISSGDDYRLRPEALHDALDADRCAGFIPLAVVGTVGTTATGAVDPLDEIATICAEQDVWLHVDAAYGGLWALLPEVHQEVGSLSRADSLVVNPHKGLFAPLGTSCLYCRERGRLTRAFRLVPGYLQSAASEFESDYMDRTLQLGRGFKALPLWWIIRSYGLTRIRDHFRTMMSLARWLEERLDHHPAFVRPAVSIYPLVTLRYVPKSERDAHMERHEANRISPTRDAQNLEFKRRVNATGKTFITDAPLHDGQAIRVSLGNIRTTRQDVVDLWKIFEEVAADLDSDFARPGQVSREGAGTHANARDSPENRIPQPDRP
ncbi:MAG TPA: aminotransferase class V-fold PLP-dependent enzyme [Solirubrobacteraceae bacterium]|jgi:aromatic-L-amino-acid decarboxylase